MAFDLTDEELQATREMNKTAWESEIDKWSKEYLIERYKDLVEIEKEHKKENGELRERVEELKTAYLLQKDRSIELATTIDALTTDYKEEKEKNKELENADLTTVYMNGFYDGEKKWKDKIKELQNKYIGQYLKFYEKVQELLEEGDDLSYITNIKNHPQLKHIEYNPYENKYKMWDGEGNYYSFIFLYSNAL